MHFLRKLWITGFLAIVSGLGSVWAQQSPSGQSPQNPGATTESPTPQSPATPANPTTTENPSVSASSASAQQHMSTQKEKHWTGSLVDVRCMAKALGSGTLNASPAATASNPTAATPHFTPAPDQLQQPGGQGAGAMPAGQAGSASRPGVGPTYPGQESGQNPDMNQTQSAQAAAAAERMDAAAKQCAASTSTQSFGLALSDGKVVQLDNQGNTQASEALKTIDVQPGKKVKAKVTGTVEDNNVVRVASVEVKGKKVNPSSSMGGPAGEVK